MKNVSLKNRLQVFIVPLLILLSAGVYWNTLSNDFVAGDRQFIVRNDHIGDFGTVLDSFTSDYWGKLGGESFMYYRPLVIATHFIDFKLYRLNPAGHHLTNILFHCLATLTVYLFFVAFLSGSRWPACAGAALFALHPIHTHSVSYVMGRTDILATLFFLWSLILLAYSTRRRPGHATTPMLLLASASFLFALLCKEIAVTLPLVFVLYRFCCVSQTTSWKDRELIHPFLFLTATLCVYLVLRAVAVGICSQHPVLPWYSVSQKTGLVLKTLGFYLAKLLYPVQLCYYANMVVPASWLELLTSPLFWTCIVFLSVTFVSIRHARALGFALGWILLTLLPVLNILMLPALAKENYLYLPSIGFCLIFAIMFDTVMVKPFGIRCASSAMLLVCGTVSIAFLYAAATINRNHDYKSPLSFLESTIKAMPPVAVSDREDPRFFEPVKNFYTGYKNLGIIYQTRNQPEKAIESFTSSLGYTPSYFSKHYAASIKVLLAFLMEHAGRLEEASVLLKEARPFSDNPAMVDYRLEMVLKRLDNNKEAELYVQQAIMKDDGRN